MLEAKATRRTDFSSKVAGFQAPPSGWFWAPLNNKEAAPTLLLHGTKDRCVSHEQSVSFYNRLRECGVHSEIELYEGKPHAWFNREPDRTRVLRRIERFLVSRFRLDQGRPR